MKMLWREYLAQAAFCNFRLWIIPVDELLHAVGKVVFGTPRGHFHMAPAGTSSMRQTNSPLTVGIHHWCFNQGLIAFFSACAEWSHRKSSRPPRLRRGDQPTTAVSSACARAGGRVAARHTDPTTTWLKHLQARRNPHIAAVALANKHARVVWALLVHDRDYKSDYAITSP